MHTRIVVGRMLDFMDKRASNGGREEKQNARRQGPRDGFQTFANHVRIMLPTGGSMSIP